MLNQLISLYPTTRPKALNKTPRNNRGQVLNFVRKLIGANRLVSIMCRLGEKNQ